MINDDIRRIVNLHNRMMNPFIIRWEVTRFCNYSCDFCIQGSHKEHLHAAQEESPSLRKEIAEGIVSFIAQHVSSHQMVQVHLIGGEVTALPDFPELLSTLVGCPFKGNITFYLTSNFSRPGAFYSSLCELFRGRANRQFILSFSFYRQYTRPDDFFRKLELLRPYLTPGFSFTRLRILTLLTGRVPAFLQGGRNNIRAHVGWPILDDDSYRDFLRFRPIAGRTGITASPIILRDYPVSLSEETKAALKSGRSKAKYNGLRVTFSDGTRLRFDNIQQLGYRLEGQEKFRPYGYRCNAGKDSFSISPDGSVERCPALHPPRDFHLGNLVKGTFRPLAHPSVCHSDHCSCNYFKKIEARSRSAKNLDT